MWTPRPDELIVLAASGSGDMGDVLDENSRARFSLWHASKAGVLPVDVDPASIVVIATVRASFVADTGAGGKADCILKVDSQFGEDHDHTLFTWPDRGVTAVGSKPSINFRTPADELFAWYAAGQPLANVFGDQFVFEWTNPDSGNLRWSLEVGLAVHRATNSTNG